MPLQAQFKCASYTAYPMGREEMSIFSFLPITIFIYRMVPAVNDINQWKLSKLLKCLIFHGPQIAKQVISGEFILQQSTFVGDK